MRRTALASAVLLGACEMWPLPQRIPARLLLGGDTAEVVVPASVRRGEAFPVTVTPFAGGCRKAAGTTTVSVDGLRADLRPHDSAIRSSYCASNLLLVPRTVTLRFDHPGTATVRVHGVTSDAEDGEAPRRMVLERPVVVW